MNDEDTTYILTHPDHGTIRNVRVSQGAREQTGVKLPLSISGFAHWQDADYLRAMGWTITATQSPATVPGDNDELLAELDFLPTYVLGTRNGELIPIAYFTRKRVSKALTDAATALRTEQRARQEAEADRDFRYRATYEGVEGGSDALQQRIEAYQKVVFDPISDYYGEIRTKFDAIDSNALTGPIEN